MPYFRVEARRSSRRVARRGDVECLASRGERPRRAGGGRRDRRDAVAIAISVGTSGTDGPARGVRRGARRRCGGEFGREFAEVVADVRRGGVAGLGSRRAAFAAVSRRSSARPASGCAIADAVPALALKGRRVRPVSGSGGRVDARIGSVVVIGVVGAALLAADVFGPGVAGIVAAFPTLSATFGRCWNGARGAARRARRARRGERRAA